MEKDKSILDSLTEWIKINECKDNIEKLIAEYNFKMSLIKDFIEKRSLIKQKNLLRKVLDKYDSDKYKDREYGQGLEPRYSLLWDLYEYASKNGIDIYEGHKEEKFLAEAYRLDELCDIFIYKGQGCIIKVNELNKY